MGSAIPGVHDARIQDLRPDAGILEATRGHPSGLRVRGSRASAAAASGGLRRHPVPGESLPREGHVDCMCRRLVAVHSRGGSPGNIEVRDCRFKGTNSMWSPTRLVPVVNVMKNAPYISQGRCRIDNCRVDERQDLGISTRKRSSVWQRPGKTPCCGSQGRRYSSRY